MTDKARERETVTVVIPTKNAAHLLGDALESVSWADEIVVVDMYSEDDTQAVCARFPQCRLLERTDYIFGNVNFGMEAATSDWIIRMDSDERIGPRLAEEIRAVLCDPPPHHVTGFEFPQEVFVLGRPMRHGAGLGTYRKMMFRRGRAHYEVRHEHEDLTTSGEWRRLVGCYQHLNYRSVSEYLRKMDYYTSRDVERIVPRSRPAARKAVLEAARAFYLYYFKKQGFRDGWIGLLDAVMRAIYQFVYRAKLLEKWELAHEQT